MVASRLTALLALALTGLMIAGCGESEEEKAKAQVCHSREQINKSVESLKSLPINSSAVKIAKEDLSKISAELSKMREAEPKLEPSIKGEIEKAQSAFNAEVTAITVSAAKELANGGLNEPQKYAPQLKQALQKLVTSYKATIGAIKC